MVKQKFLYRFWWPACSVWWLLQHHSDKPMYPLNRKETLLQNPQGILMVFKLLLLFWKKRHTIPFALKQESCTERCISFSWETKIDSGGSVFKSWSRKRKCLSGWLWTLPCLSVPAFLLQIHKKKRDYISWSQRTRAVPRWQLAMTTNLESILVPTLNIIMKSLYSSYASYAWELHFYGK